MQTVNQGSVSCGGPPSCLQPGPYWYFVVARHCSLLKYTCSFTHACTLHPVTALMTGAKQHSLVCVILNMNTERVGLRCLDVHNLPPASPWRKPMHLFSNLVEELVIFGSLPCIGRVEMITQFKKKFKKSKKKKLLAWTSCLTLPSM